MKKILLPLALFMATLTSSFAVDRVYTNGHIVGIVADDKDWSCSVTDKNPLISTYSHGQFIKGTSKQFPLTFMFFIKHYRDFEDFKREVQITFRQHAIKTNTLITDITFKLIKQKSHNQNLEEAIVEGMYYNGIESGYFRYHYSTVDQQHVVMYSQINSQVLDEHSRNVLYAAANSLITPLYKPRALSLWLEQVDCSE